jgi:hypothetical protein
MVGLINLPGTTFADVAEPAQTSRLRDMKWAGHRSIPFWAELL